MLERKRQVGQLVIACSVGYNAFLLAIQILILLQQVLEKTVVFYIAHCCTFTNNFLSLTWEPRTRHSATDDSHQGGVVAKENLPQPSCCTLLVALQNAQSWLLIILLSTRTHRRQRGLHLYLSLQLYLKQLCGVNLFCSILDLVFGGGEGSCLETSCKIFCLRKWKTCCSEK